jgi:putative redox protein
MKATAHRSTPTRLVHTVDVRTHRLTVDEPVEQGGDDEGPSPQELLAASLAACTAITVEMYAQRKGWDLGLVDVEVEYTPAERGAPTKFRVDVRLPEHCTDEQRERLRIIATKCPVHRTLEGEVVFEDHISFGEPAEDRTGSAGATA